MKTTFNLVFDEREDGTRVWSAECRGCGSLLVGERYPQVTLVQLKDGERPISPPQFSALQKQVHAAWKSARSTGNPILIPDDRFVVSTVNDHGDLQRALEAHAESCPGVKSD